MENLKAAAIINGQLFNLGEVIEQVRNTMLSSPETIKLVHRCRKENLAEDLTTHLAESGISYEAFLADIITGEFVNFLCNVIKEKGAISLAQTEIAVLNPTLN